MAGIVPVVADMAHFNRINFTQLKTSSIVGLIHKATQGPRVHDPRYAQRRQMAKDNGFLWGAYNFATSDEPKTAALDFIHVAAPDDKTLMCLDFEDNPGHQMSGDQAFVFLDTMIQKLGRKVWIYGGNTIKERISPHAGEQRWKDMANNVHLWRPRFLNSHFENSTELFKAVGTLAPWEKLTMVQYAADGSGPQPHTVPGLENGADLNATIMTADELRAMWPG